ncbi:MAG: glycosyl transferase family 1 [Flavobacteriales bacterium]|nr:glycosyl transferase family 1 [Flavobacteriales bacterium]
MEVIRKKILFVYPHKASFIDLDIQQLSCKFDVIECVYNWHNKILTPFFMIIQFMKLLFTGNKYNNILISFGGYWALAPTLIGRLYKKPVYIILHGTDSVSFPEINYGSFRNKALSKILRFCYKKADRLLPVSDSLIYTENNYFKKGKVFKLGCKIEIPGLKTPFTTIFNGFEIDKWNLISEKKNRFITILSEERFLLKGGDLIIKVAEKFPEYEFRIIGLNTPDEFKDVPVNVEIYGKRSKAELALEYSEAKFYFQLSNWEGFGCALCEAMLCESIPIVSNVNFLPGIVGDTGYVLKERSVKELVKVVQEAIDTSGVKASPRERVINKFSIERRKAELFKVLD